MLEQVGNPLGVFDIRLAPRYCFDMVRVHHQDFQVAFQDIEDGFPEIPVLSIATWLHAALGATRAGGANLESSY